MLKLSSSVSILKLFNRPTSIKHWNFSVRNPIIPNYSTGLFFSSKSIDIIHEESSTSFTYSPDKNSRSQLPDAVKNNPRLIAELYKQEFEHSSSSEEIVAIERSDIDPYTLESSSVNTNNDESNQNIEDKSMNTPHDGSNGDGNNNIRSIHTLPADLAAKVRKHAGRPPVIGSSRARG